MHLIICILVPPNGLVIYCGTIVTEEGKEKKVNIDFEPFKPINTSLYLCDNKVCFTFANVILVYEEMIFMQAILHLAVSHRSAHGITCG